MDNLWFLKLYRYLLGVLFLPDKKKVSAGSFMNNLEKNIWKLHKPLGIKNSWIWSHTESSRILSVLPNHLIISTTISFFGILAV